MQPLDDRNARHLRRGRDPRAEEVEAWELKEFLTVAPPRRSRPRLDARGAEDEERPVAVSLLGNLFYAKAWSLVYFLWYAEESGKPKYRDRYIEYLKYESTSLQDGRDEEGEVSVPSGANDLRRILASTRTTS